MAEIRIKRVPQELKDLLSAEAKRLGMDVRAVELMRLWGGGLIGDTVGGTNGTPKGAYKGTRGGTKSEGERFQLPEWVPKIPWGHYEEMRRKIRKPLTEAAKKTAVETLEKLRADGHDPGKVLEQSVFKCWQGLFPLDGGTNGEGRRLSASEQRTRDAINNLNELYPLDSGATDDSGGGEGSDHREGAAADVRGGSKRLIP